jgi:hypothetical protein
MWLAPLVQVLILTAVEPAAAAPASPVPTFYSREARFAIPYHLNRPSRLSREPAEVQLYFSTDRGGQWQFYSKVAPAAGRFLFRAPIDGEYWFTVRTVDRAGQPSGVAANAVQLIVVVDTTPPKLQISARRGSTGETIVHWQIEELHPKPGSLSLQYRAVATLPWQEVKFERAEPGAIGPLQSGEVVLYPPAEVAELELRGEVLDLAGNAGVGQVKINMRDLGAPSTSISIPATTSPPAMAPAGPDARQAPAAPQASDAGRPGGDLPTTAWPASNGSTPGQVGDDRDPAARDWPASPLRPASGQTRVEFSDQGRTEPQDGSVAVQINSPGRSPLAAQDGQGAAPGRAAEGSPPSPPARSAPAAVSAAAASGLPAGEKLHMVNTRIFELEYDLQSVGPSGVKQVELWGTRDGGRTWRRFAVDQSKRSPLVVTVAEAGTYGFRLVVQSGAGLGGRPPQSGDPPEIWIGVDLTKPVVRITSAQQGNGADAANLNIAWEASDDVMLAPRPITLSFSQTRGGPWIPIASGLENTGHYSWAIDNRMPSRVYLRAEARDEAGNIGAYETPQSVSLDQMSPQAHIRDVHPVGQSGQRLIEPSFAP